MNQMMDLAQRPEVLAPFALIFAAVFNSWLGETFYSNRFDPNDLVTNIGKLLQMVGIAAMADGMGGYLIPHGSTTFQYGYATVRIVLVAKYMRAWYHLPKQRTQLLAFILGFSLSVVCWVLSALIEQHRVLLCVVGLAFDYITPWAILLYQRMPPVQGACRNGCTVLQ
jgi:low temperature requirement protein LtrA